MEARGRRGPRGWRAHRVPALAHGPHRPSGFPRRSPAGLGIGHHGARTRPIPTTGKKPYTQARPLGLDEIPRLLGDYERAARNAIAAGFDGVQIHAANGYLIDQFLRDGSNLRDDAYGGSIENRVRLLREVTQAVAGTVGPERTAVRLSPNGEIQGVDDSNPEALFGAAASALAKVGVAFLELREPGPNGTFGTSNRPPIAPAIKRAFGGPLVLNSDYDGPRAEAALEAGEADAIAFGRAVHRQPRPAGAARQGGCAEQGRRQDLVQPGPGRLPRLSDPRRGQRRLSRRA